MRVGVRERKEKEKGRERVRRDTNFFLISKYFWTLYIWYHICDKNMPTLFQLIHLW